MLAQAFLSADELQITERQKDALIKTLVLMETGKLQHMPLNRLTYQNEIERPYHKFSGLFNMRFTIFEHFCGTVGCIKGTAEMISGISLSSRDLRLHELFYTEHMNDRDIGVAEGAIALRSYLTTGNANWAAAMGEA